MRPGCPVTSSPCSSTFPARGMVRPARACKSVVLPMPDLPTRHTVSPGRTTMSTPSTTGSPSSHASVNPHASSAGCVACKSVLPCSVLPIIQCLLRAVDEQATFEAKFARAKVSQQILLNLTSPARPLHETTFYSRYSLVYPLEGSNGFSASFSSLIHW